MTWSVWSHCGWFRMEKKLLLRICRPGQPLPTSYSTTAYLQKNGCDALLVILLSHATARKRNVVVQGSLCVFPGGQVQAKSTVDLPQCWVVGPVVQTIKHTRDMLKIGLHQPQSGHSSTLYTLHLFGYLRGQSSMCTVHSTAALSLPLVLMASDQIKQGYV